MATTNGNHSSINKVLILGVGTDLQWSANDTAEPLITSKDNHLAASIISSLAHKGLEVHQAIHPQSTSTSNHHITTHQVDFSATSLPFLLQAIQPDIIFSTQSAGSYGLQKQIIDVAIGGNVKRFVPAEFKEDALNAKVHERLPPVGERGRVIGYLQEQAARGLLEWVGVATGCSLEQGLVSGNMGFDLKWQSATIHGTGNERFAASSTGWVGQIAAGIVEHWDALKNQYLYASGMMTSANEILECIKQKTSQQWEAGYSDIEDIVHEAERRFERGFPDAGMFLMERSVLFDEGLNSSGVFVREDAKGKLGLEKGEALPDVMQRVVHEVKHHGRNNCGCG